MLLEIFKYPCCGGEGKLVEQEWYRDELFGSKDLYRIQCCECGLNTIWYENPDIAIIKWNSRDGIGNSD